MKLILRLVLLILATNIIALTAVSEIIKKRDPTIDPYADDYQTAQQNLLFIFICNLMVMILVVMVKYVSFALSVYPLVVIILCMCYLIYFVTHGIYQIIGRFRPRHSQVGMTSDMKRLFWVAYISQIIFWTLIGIGVLLLSMVMYQIMLYKPGNNK